MQNNIFKIDYHIKTLKRARISSDIVNHNFLIKLSENQILSKINSFASKIEVLAEFGSNSNIGEMYSKSNNCLFISIDNSIDFLKQNSSSNNNLVIDENNLPFKQESFYNSGLMIFFLFSFSKFAGFNTICSVKHSISS